MTNYTAISSFIIPCQHNSFFVSTLSPTFVLPLHLTLLIVNGDLDLMLGQDGLLNTPEEGICIRAFLGRGQSGLILGKVGPFL